ncbi:clathrin light chain B isoform X6 [Paramormyrops kingsleyae]|uniref:clathrin light chain B isoform X6 n=1 Tax=Paramormyrops kingsleyae TaxID=1676925 RepID=UPI000CD64A80|nr:clathrin light chain B isoform X6 [Paramormyrops kingsleyae]
MADDFGFFSSSGNGAPAAEDDPAAAFLAQQESEIAGIENDEAFGTLEEAEQPHYPPSQTNYNVFGEEAATVNGDMFSESNGPTDSYAAIARVDLQRQEPESLRRWREEQRARLEELDSASKAAEAEWKERAKKELEDWHVHQSEQMEKNKVNNRASEEAFLKESDEDTPGSEWERVARLCDFNPKTNKQSKDVSRMRSVLISLKQTPLLR